MFLGFGFMGQKLQISSLSEALENLASPFTVELMLHPGLPCETTADPFHSNMDRYHEHQNLKQIPELFKELGVKTTLFFDLRRQHVEK